MNNFTRYPLPNCFRLPELDLHFSFDIPFNSEHLRSLDCNVSIVSFSICFGTGVGLFWYSFGFALMEQTSPHSFVSAKKLSKNYISVINISKCRIKFFVSNYHQIISNGQIYLIAQKHCRLFLLLVRFYHSTP